MVVKFSFYCKGERVVIVRVLKNFLSQALGLMFWRNSNLLFVFKKKNKQSIHSFFCKPFIAIWLDGKEVVDIKFVKPWKISVKPNSGFDKLLEIPISSKVFKDFKKFC